MKLSKPKKISGCNICGSKLVKIRGRFPRDFKRSICPCCACEKLEQINEISSLHYGQAYSDVK